MSRRGGWRPLLAGLALAPFVLGAGDCDGTPPGQGDPIPVRVHLTPLEGAYPAQTLDTEIVVQGGEADLTRSLFIGTVFTGRLLASSPDGGEPLPTQGTVFLRLPGTVSSRSVAVDDSGEFQIEDVFPAIYDVFATPPSGTSTLYVLGLEGVEVYNGAPHELVLETGQEVTARVLREREDDDGGISLTGADRMTVEPVARDALGEWQAMGPSDTTAADTGLFTLALSSQAEGLRISSPDPDGPPLPTVVVEGLTLPDALVPANEGETVTLYTYPLIPSVTVSGVVTDPTPDPNAVAIEDAEVRLDGTCTFTDAEGELHTAPFRRRVRTDASGRWQMEVPDCTYTVTIVPGYGADVSAAVYGDTAPIPARDLVNAQFTLPNRVELRGQVVDPDGEPVSGARVVIRSLGPSGYVWLQTTDADGQFRQAADVGAVSVEVLPPDGSSLASPEPLTWYNQDGLPPQTVTLSTGVRITGRITYHSNSVPNVRVQVADPETGEVLGEGQTDVDGYFELRLREEWVRSR